MSRTTLASRPSGALGVLTKFWIPGRVKTRLIPALGAADAARLHQALASYTLRSLATAGEHRVVAVAPAAATAEVAAVGGPRWTATAQSEGNLGGRIEALLRSLLAHADAAVVVGTDCPALTPSIVAEALQRLRQDVAVIGPAADGGYYLIGLRGPWDESMSRLFAAIDWGTERVAAQTIQAADSLGWTVDSLGTLGDVDVPEDLLWLERWLASGGGDRQLRSEVAAIVDRRRN